MPDEKNTNTDPLTSATRDTKKNLLAVALVAITYKAFDISTDTIPIAGMAIKFDRSVFEFLLLVVLAYQLITFILYYYIDIRNFDRLAHQDATEKWRQGRVNSLTYAMWRNAGAKTQPRADSSDTSTSKIRISAAQGYWEHLNKWTKDTPGLVRLLIRMRREPIKYAEIISVHRIDDARNITIGEDLAHAEIRKAAEESLRAYSRWFPLRYLWVIATTSPRTWTVRTAYFLRNYGFDGVLPVIAALIALTALYGFLDVHALARLGPHSPS
jgi:hypothetical protein